MIHDPNRIREGPPGGRDGPLRSRFAPAPNSVPPSRSGIAFAIAANWSTSQRLASRIQRDPRLLRCGADHVHRGNVAPRVAERLAAHPERAFHEGAERVRLLGAARALGLEQDSPRLVTSGGGWNEPGPTLNSFRVLNAARVNTVRAPYVLFAGIRGQPVRHLELHHEHDAIEIIRVRDRALQQPSGDLVRQVPAEHTR